MAKAKKVRPVLDDCEPTSLRLLLARFLESLAVRNYAATTIRCRRDDLEKLIEWCEARAVVKAAEVSREQIERYQRWLASYQREGGQRLGAQTQARLLTSVRVFFRWLWRHKYIHTSPAAELELPKVGQKLPKAILTEQEVESVMMLANIETARGMRDRAIMETFYSTGIRRAELVGLKLVDLDKERGMVMVRGGKGNKDRMIPIGERALKWIEKYLVAARPELIKGEDEGLLFVNGLGQRWTVSGLGNLVHRYIEKAQIGKSGACHLFRHTCATLMLEGGADIRYIQQMLGHEELSTTQIYTLVSDRKLKEVHSQSHPAAKLQRRRKPSVDEE